MTDHTPALAAVFSEYFAGHDSGAFAPPPVPGHVADRMASGAPAHDDLGLVRIRVRSRRTRRARGPRT